VFLKTSNIVFFLNIELEGPMKALASIRKNMANPDDLGSMMKNIGVPLPQDVIQSALKNVTIMGKFM